MSHAFAAYKMGDHTARNLGRMTLNPAVHLDFIGTACMLFFGFGWAKPVPVNSRNFRNPRKGIIVTSIAGPLSNLLLSFAALLVFSLVCAFLRVPYAIDGNTAFGGKLLYFLTELLWYFHILNLYLAVFNLIPIPPLDGSKVLFMFLPAKIYFFVSKYERYISLALLALLYLGVLSTPIAWICSYISYGMSLLIGLIPGV